MFKLLRYAKKYILPAIISPIFMVGEVVLELMIPLVMAEIVNLIQSEGFGDQSLNQMLRYGLRMLIYALGSLCCGTIAARAAAVAGMGFGAKLRENIMNKIQTFSFSNIDRFSTASLITRITTDVNSVQNTFVMMIRMLFRAPVQFVIALVFTIRMSKEISGAFAVSLPLIAIILIIFAPIALKRFKKLLEMFDGFNASIQENLTNIRVVKAFVRSDYEKDKFKTANDNLLKAALHAEKLMILGQPTFMLIMYCTILAVLYIAAKVISAETLNIGDFTAVYTYAMQILMSFLMVIFLIAQFFMSQASAKRINEVIREVPDIRDDNATHTIVKDGSIEFKNVSFKYDGANNPVIKNADFRIESGEMVGIIGATGSAKTTLVQLIPRLYDVTEGNVLVGGVDVKDYKIHALREEVSMVLQKNVLFSGTISENLRWGNKNATDEDLVEACKIADAHAFVSAFPDGYNTDLTQGGSNVSGGQKQRLCIARAILKKPKILILDDSTSAVDTFTDSKIRKGLRECIPDTTKIIIAQRISSVEDCDKIIILENGGINDIGTHDQLLERNEIYKDIYDSQQKGGDDFDLQGGAN
ncbi:MAG: ABC transporter ATP-binding protein [Clostridia bacterium]|nr:ABC transporter ATP-binding protein [Clostridia bacterium]MBR5543842.1 ABC transporter ATP-binding protein [Clostridia bacterium]